jgi:hypothetical protein
LTWQTYADTELYYALIGGDGSIVTPPMIWYVAQPTTYPGIDASRVGYGIAPLDLTPAANVDGTVIAGGTVFYGEPGEIVAVRTSCVNQGLATATGVALTATLNSGLSYSGDNSGLMPTIVGDDVGWSLPEMSFLDSLDFTLYVRIPFGATAGDVYPLSFTLVSDGPEANPADNTDAVEIRVLSLVHLPLVLKGN